jgi:hypothetical protein
VSRDGRGVGSGTDIGRGSRIGTGTRNRNRTDAGGVGRATFTNHHVVRPGAYR